MLPVSGKPPHRPVPSSLPKREKALLLSDVRSSTMYFVVPMPYCSESKLIIEAHHGSIKAGNSEKYGGAEFVVTLPMYRLKTKYQSM